MVVALTGLTHLGSAQSRDSMHAKLQSADLTDSMKMFKLGLEGGKPAAGAIGVQPEWAYKGDGSWLVAPEQPLELPGYAEDGGEEGEVAGLYVIGDGGEVLRVGFALGNEYSDHVMERRNYLYLAHSKLRQSSFGPELLVGELPQEVTGTVRIIRDGGEPGRASCSPAKPTCATRSPTSSTTISSIPTSAGRATCTSISSARAGSAPLPAFPPSRATCSRSNRRSSGGRCAIRSLRADPPTLFR